MSAFLRANICDQAQSRSAAALIAQRHQQSEAASIAVKEAPAAGSPQPTKGKIARLAGSPAKRWLYTLGCSIKPMSSKDFLASLRPLSEPVFIAAALQERPRERQACSYVWPKPWLCDDSSFSCAASGSCVSPTGPASRSRQLRERSTGRSAQGRREETRLDLLQERLRRLSSASGFSQWVVDPQCFQRSIPARYRMNQS